MNRTKTIRLGILGLTIVLISSISAHQSYAIETITADLSEVDENQFMQGATIYKEVSDLTTNSSLYTDIEPGDGYIYNTVSDDTMNLNFPAKVPDPENPNREFVIEVNANLNAESIETNPDTGLITYYAEPEFSTLVSGDVAIASAQLEQTSDEDATLILTLFSPQ